MTYGRASTGLGLVVHGTRRDSDNLVLSAAIAFIEAIAALVVHTVLPLPTPRSRLPPAFGLRRCLLDVLNTLHEYWRGSHAAGLSTNSACRDVLQPSITLQATPAPRPSPLAPIEVVPSSSPPESPETRHCQT
ncbi:hypothetical protein RR46_02383 [Papilio xuthus]|uniref:Uncharacterized protein n=1 Tax=Papilio xuthus TaxID=66420 RepID=A0A194Q0T8_PAPXU|nr:hypothetical protein RR46_02383 [Papilio xuthus]